MTTVAVEPASADADGVADLLELAVGGSDPDRLRRVRASYLAGPAELAAAVTAGSLAGVVGYRLTDGRSAFRKVELLHIATAHHWQRRGVGTAMIRWVQA